MSGELRLCVRVESVGISRLSSAETGRNRASMYSILKARDFVSSAVVKPAEDQTGLNFRKSNGGRFLTRASLARSVLLW